MSPSYPVASPAPPGAAEAASTTPQTHQHATLSPHQHPPHHQFDNGGLSSSVAQSATAAEAAAVAAAATTIHQGLRALQAAPAVAGAAPGQSPVTHQYPPPLHPHNDSHYSPGTSLSPAQQHHKGTRLRRACDMCSQRKVKCDESGPPCRQCLDLKVECTFNREMKRRGPPNKHAEAAKAAKRPRLEPSLGPSPHTAASTLISIAANPGSAVIGSALDAELIAPWPVLELLVDDFFTYIHPLTPFPHEPTFRESFRNREDRTSCEFLALLASMIGFLVASFPRTARLHLKKQHSGNLFPRAITMIERCRLVALEARGPLFTSKDEVTVYDAATSYFLGVAAAYTMHYKICRRFMAETMNFIRELGYHRPPDVGSSMFHVTYRGPGFDHVKDQIGKRIFWVMFLGIRSVSQLGTHTEIALPPPTPSDPYPEFPAEVDDQYILQHQILGQPEGTISLLTGFNQAIKIYMTMNGLVSVELSYGITSLPWPDQRNMLVDCLQAAKQVMDDLPRELTLESSPPQGGGPSSSSTGTPNPFSAPSSDMFDDVPGYQYQPPAFPAAQPPNDIRHVIVAHPMRRRLLQYEIQKANIYASQLATRSYYVERYLNLRDVHREHSRNQAVYAGGGGVNGGFGSADDHQGNKDAVAAAAAAVHAAAEQSDPVDGAMTSEREHIVHNLVEVLTSIPQRNLEPNGASVITKIRQVASTLLNDAPERKGPVAVKADEYLHGFVGILMRLEKTGPGTGRHGGQFGGAMSGGGGAMTPQDEEDELRSWADLREYQVRLMQHGGFLGI